MSVHQWCRNCGGDFPWPPDGRAFCSDECRLEAKRIDLVFVGLMRNAIDDGRYREPSALELADAILDGAFGLEAIRGPVWRRFRIDQMEEMLDGQAP